MQGGRQASSLCARHACLVKASVSVGGTQRHSMSVCGTQRHSVSVCQFLWHRSCVGPATCVCHRSGCSVWHRSGCSVATVRLLFCFSLTTV